MRFPAFENRYSIWSGADVLWIENGIAPRCRAAVSTRLSSGRLTSSSATVSPRPAPSEGKPPAIRRTRSAYSRYVIATVSPGVRSAIWSVRSAAVI
jgi:hypothetical protein